VSEKAIATLNPAGHSLPRVVASSCPTAFDQPCRKEQKKGLLVNKRKFLASSFAAAISGAGFTVRGRAQGKAVPMVKLVFLLHRRPGMGLDEFRRHWRDVHAPIGASMPGVRKYVQNHAGATLDGSALPCDGFAEMWFDDMGSLQRALTSPQGQAALADSKNFLDVERVQTFVVEEVPVV
jgi:uncharacterized protein (TIGR02118 family)